MWNYTVQHGKFMRLVVLHPKRYKNKNRLDPFLFLDMVLFGYGA
jgi:hypothetical protein